MSEAINVDQLGVYLFTWGGGEQPPTVDDLVATARRAEELGYGSIHLAWHFVGEQKFGTTYNLDPLVVAPMLVAATSRIRISINAVILPLLHPYYWTRYLANLDLISGGRVIITFALGWAPDDFRIGLSKTKERGRRLDEGLQVVTQLLNGEEITEKGRFWDSTGLRLEPVPRRDIPIWIGAGEKSFDRAGRWASALNPTRRNIDEIRDVLRPGVDEAAARHGRSVELVVTQNAAVVLPTDDEEWQRVNVWDPLAKNPAIADCDGTVIGSPAECAEKVAAQFAAGVDHLILEFDFHGAIPAGEFVRDQLSRVVDDVLPLTGQEN